MHSNGRSILWTVSVLFLISFANATSLTLSLLQRISGFSSTCAQAYNTPLTYCTLSELTDHAPGRACSLDCVEQLERVSVSINTQCKGTRAYPDTLIGMFFNQTGVTTLCPNVLSGGSGGNNEGQSSQSATSASASASETVARTTAQTTQTQASTTRQRSTQALASSTVVSISFSSSTAPTSSSVSTSETQAAEPTLNSAATLTQTQLSEFGSNTATAASSLTSSSASASASSSQDRDGNRSGSGGTPFDISASSRNAARMSWVIPTIMCLLGATWLV